MEAVDGIAAWVGQIAMVFEDVADDGQSRGRRLVRGDVVVTAFTGRSVVYRGMRVTIVVIADTREIIRCPPCSWSFTASFFVGLC